MVEPLDEAHSASPPPLDLVVPTGSNIFEPGMAVGGRLGSGNEHATGEVTGHEAVRLEVFHVSPGKVERAGLAFVERSNALQPWILFDQPLHEAEPAPFLGVEPHGSSVGTSSSAKVRVRLSAARPSVAGRTRSQLERHPKCQSVPPSRAFKITTRL